MALPHFLQQHLYRRGWKPATYEELMAPFNPNAHMLSRLLSMAACSHRKGKLLFGMPPGRTLTREEQASFEEMNAKMRKQLDPAKQTAEDIERMNRCSTPAMRASVTPELRSGNEYVPIWLGYDDAWELLRIGLFAAQYAEMQSHAMDRLVTLDASPQEPQPRKWIEYDSIDSMGQKDRRHFAEVRLYYEENLSFTIEIISTRQEPASVRVSLSTEGHVPKG